MPFRLGIKAVLASLLFLWGVPACFAANVIAWGSNAYGQASVPPDLTNAIAVAAGYDHSLALRSDGTAIAWGDNSANQTNVPPTLSDIVAIGAGKFFSLAVKSDGTVTGWGAAPANLASLSNIVAVAGGEAHLLALRSDGTVVALGDNSYSQCNVPADLSNVVAIAAGTRFSCALKKDGYITTWGSWNSNGELNAPQTGRGVDLAGSGSHGLMLTAEGIVHPWGDSEVSNFGHYSIYPPVWYPGTGTGDAAMIGSGSVHFLAGSVNGNPIVWGYNGSGQLNIPAGLSNVVALAGGGFHSLALIGSGAPQLVNPRLGLSMLPPSMATSSETVTLHVSAVGAAPLTYYWLFNGSNFQTTTLPRLYVTNVQPAQAGTYSVIVSNAQGWIYGSNQMLAVQALKLTGQSADQNVFEAADVSLNVAAVGASLQYQWRLNNSDLPGRTNSTLSLPVVATNQAGLYSVLVSNLYGSQLSSNIQLIVTLPAITAQPTNRIVNGGDSTSLTLTANGAALKYQWLFNGTNLPGATNATLTLNMVTTNVAGDYQALVSNAYRVLQSSNIQLDVVPLTISQPASRTVYTGDAATFNVTVQGTGPFTYQWYRDGVELANATNSSLTLSSLIASQSGNYSVLVANSYGTVLSSNALLTVTASLPVITGQPANQGAYPGGTASFRVVADGSKPLFYQWLRDGTTILGANTTNLVLNNLAPTDAGLYSVLVSNSIGTTLSSNTSLAFLNVKTWGMTNNNSLGILPVDLTNVIAVAVGNSHSVALKSNGRVVAWGYNGNGQTNVPASATNVIAIAAAQDHTLALRSNGTVVAWGTGGIGVPAGLSNVIAVSAGNYHSMALKADGTVIAWGDPNVSASTTNVPAGATNVVAIAAGGNFCVALKQNRTVLTWGTSLSFLTITNAVAIAASEFPIVILRADGKVYATNVLAAPAGLSNCVSVAAGRYHAMALKSDGTVTNWVSGSPVTPVGLSNVTTLVSGQYHCLAIIGNGPRQVDVPYANPSWNSNAFSLSLPGQSGHLYWLEFKNSLDDTNWTSLPMSLGNGSTISLTNTPATNAQRFYRVREW